MSLPRKRNRNGTESGATECESHPQACLDGPTPIAFYLDQLATIVLVDLREATK